MKKAFKLVIAPVLAVCLAGSLCLAACSSNSDDGGDDGNTPATEKIYTFEAEKAQLSADESELLTTLSNTEYGEYVTDCVFNVQYDNGFSGGASVGYLAENNPTITFVINSDVAVSGAQISIKAASMDLELSSMSSILGGIYGLAAASINDYKGEDHDILKVNGESVALSGTLEGSETVFKDVDSLDDILGSLSSGIGALLSNLNFDNFGTLTATVDLKAGENTFVFTIENGAGLNFDYMQITTTATLTWTETDNSDFVNGTVSTVIPPDDDDEEGNEGNESAYDNTLTLGAEYAALFNAEGSSAGSTEAIATETSTVDEEEITNVKNFNVEGDKIVFEVLASADIEDVALTIMAKWTSSSSNYNASGDSTLLSVNGETATLTGSLTSGSYQAMTATISLDAGINHIVLTADGSGSYLGTLNLGWMNIWKIDLGWDGEETITTNAVATNLTKLDSSTGTATIELEEASLINAAGKTDGLTDGLLKTETISQTTTDEDSGEETTEYRSSASIGNFNTQGDTVVVAVYSDADIESVTLTLTAGTAIYKISLSGGFKAYLGDYVGSEHDILSVNGTSAALSGTITGNEDTLDYYNCFGTLSATISLSKGINYIVFTADSTAGINLDSITLTWTVASDDAEATT
ncbi:MAG: hypothetical protein LUD50_06530 [Clostridia bacterium]|nr:hypothetical protein [Clostridia bacterium]